MKRLILASTQYKCSEYDEYLNQHITGVLRSWDEILKPELEAHPSLYGVTDDDILQCDNFIRLHDQSKYEPEEYSAYGQWWYPRPGQEKDEDAYNRAWLHHQHNSPHHWQHWVIRKDSGKEMVLDMPANFVMEMLCDWHSFSLSDPKDTAKNWWDKNQENMSLSSATKSLVKKLIKIMDTPLTAEE